MKRSHPLSTAAALGLVLLAAPALAQRHGSDAPPSVAPPQNRGAAEGDRERKGDGAMGSDARHLGAQGGGQGDGIRGGRSGAVGLGMGSLPGSGNVLGRDRGTGGTGTSGAEGIVLAQSGTRGSGGLPPGDSLPGWSDPRRGGGVPGGQATTGGGITTPAAPNQDMMPDSFMGRGVGTLDFSSPLSGPGSAGVTGGAPARVGGAPPADTSRAPGSSGIGPTGPTGFGMAGPLR